MRWWERFPAIVDRVRDGVLHVQAVGENGEGFAAGTGFLVDRRHAVASAQVVAAGDAVTVRTPDGRKAGAEVLGVDPVYLLAVIRLEGALPQKPPPLVYRRPPRLGTPVVLAGCPFGPEPVVSGGMVSAIDLTVYRQDRVPIDGLMAADAALHPGNLGGPVVSPEGEVLGISLLPWVTGFHLAVQADVVARVVNQIIEYGRATHPWLGFSGQAEVIESHLRDLFSLPVDRGLVVSHVVPGGPGERAGVQVFDMVVSVEGEAVSTVGAIRRRLSNHRSGEAAQLTVLRSGRLMDLSFPVEEIPRVSSAGQN